MKIVFVLILIIFIDFQPAELLCLQSYHSCGKNELFKCIPNDWVCDHNQDCDDGSDETDCPNNSCNAEEFLCTNSDQCVKKSQLCDGNKDCIDNSDENNCTGKNYCMKKMEYDCLNDVRSECIPLANVCNNNGNCSNGRNLKEDCNKNMCKSPNKGYFCSHLCINKYSSFLCDCPDGMKVGEDKMTCSKINRCFENPDRCDQECTIINDVPVCSCYEGYKKIAEQCKATNFDSIPYLVYSTANGIYDVTLVKDKSTSFQSRKLVSSSDKLLNFDVKINDIYLEIYASHVDNEAALSLNILTGWNKQSNILSIQNIKDSSNVTFSTSFYSIASDPVRNLVFWTNTNSSKISVFNASSFDTSDVIVEDCYFPLSLVVDPLSAKIFWIDLGNGVTRPKISMSNMDGTNRKDVLLSELRKPTSLALDIDSQLLYWNDLHPGSIKFLDLKLFAEGKNEITVVFESVDFFPVSLAIFKNRIYWSDWHQNRIYSVHKISGKGLMTIVEQVQASTIRIISSLINLNLIKKVNDLKEAGSCSEFNNPCQYSCLPSFSKDKPKCFGSFHLTLNQPNSHSSAWWFILIPIAILAFVCVAIVRYRKVKRWSLENVEGISRLNSDHVKFLDEGNEDIITDSKVINVPEAMPILQTV